MACRYGRLAYGLTKSFNAKWGDRGKKLTAWVYRVRKRAVHIRTLAATARCVVRYFTGEAVSDSDGSARIVEIMQKREQYVDSLSLCLRSRDRAIRWKKVRTCTSRCDRSPSC